VAILLSLFVNLDENRREGFGKNGKNMEKIYDIKKGRL